MQQKIHAYVESLKSCGVDGIRWDAAKHIGLPSEGDSFWQNVPDKSMYNYGEILDGTGGNDSKLLPEYQKYISITDNGYGQARLLGREPRHLRQRWWFFEVYEPERHRPRLCCRGR